MREQRACVAVVPLARKVEDLAEERSEYLNSTALTSSCREPD
jgi:hypothetical protein